MTARTERLRAVQNSTGPSQRVAREGDSYPVPRANQRVLAASPQLRLVTFDGMYPVADGAPRRRSDGRSRLQLTRGPVEQNFWPEAPLAQHTAGTG